MFVLEQHGPDTFVGEGPRYPWGGLYGGQIVAQALRAAAYSVEPEYAPHSIRAYFIRPGDHAEPVRYEVDRIRNGRSFTTRRVVARQAIGAILNAECSFQRAEESAEVQTVDAPTVPSHDTVDNTSFTTTFRRHSVAVDPARSAVRTGAGRSTAWMKVSDPIERDDERDRAPGALLDQCWLAYLSDDLATDAVRSAYLQYVEHADRDELTGVSLDHTVWFHRPLRADEWHLHDVTCHHFAGGRGLAVGHVFDASGRHAVTYAQEVLVRVRRPDPTA
jgi:acyl-CoA thioesterase II